MSKRDGSQRGRIGSSPAVPSCPLAPAASDSDGATPDDSSLPTSRDNAGRRLDPARGGERRSGQASAWRRKNSAIDTLRSAAMESVSRFRSAPDIGLKSRASSAFRSMYSPFGMPRLVRLTGSDRA